MSRKTRVGQDIVVESIETLLGTAIAENTTLSENAIVQLPAAEMVSFQNHPFKVIMDESMLELIESIKESGILVPVEVRIRPEGGYEIISGHRRHFAAVQAGIDVVPAIIREMDDDTAVLRMVDSNLYRPNILPSEKAWSYKMRLDAMKRQGKRSDLTSSQVGTKLRTDQELAEKAGESRNQIQRYVRLTFLYADLLEMVDLKKIPLNVGVAVSYLEEIQQIWLYELLNANLGYTLSISQAEKLKKFQSDHKLTKGAMEAILSEEMGAGPKISIKAKEIAQYFPPDTSPQEMQQTILKLLENWMNKRA